MTLGILYHPRLNRAAVIPKRRLFIDARVVAGGVC